MPKPRAHAAQFRRTLGLFAIFGHPIRVVMFQRLAKTPMTAGDLAKTLPISRTAVVQHLKRMEAVRLVDAVPCHKRRLYRIRPEGLEPLALWLENHRLQPSTKRRAASTNTAKS
jgi:DNA-binding transcriptional ArsR family regulator